MLRVCPRCKSIYSTPVSRCVLDGSPIVEQEEDPLVGAQIDHYRIQESIGRGAMGCVYAAKHAILQNECAIKVLYGNFAFNRRLTERFRREAQAAGKMDHPNIVSVLDFGRTQNGLTYLVMEMVRGSTLEEVIEKDGPFSPIRAARIARQVAAALEEAHARGFVHRDLKPANIMLTTSGPYEMAKLLDFGVVGLIQAAATAKLTAVGHIVGTPSYMAPEQARESRVTPAADLYALGIIIYEMLSGRAPFDGGVTEVLLKQIAERPPPLAPSRGLERLVYWLLEKKPDQRPSSATQVIEEIDKLNLGTHTTQQIVAAGERSKEPRPPRQFATTADAIDVDVAALKRAAARDDTFESFVGDTSPGLSSERPAPSSIEQEENAPTKPPALETPPIDHGHEEAVHEGPTEFDILLNQPALLVPRSSEIDARLEGGSTPRQPDAGTAPPDLGGVPRLIRPAFIPREADLAPTERDLSFAATSKSGLALDAAVPAGGSAGLQRALDDRAGGTRKRAAVILAGIVAFLALAFLTFTMLR